MPKPLDYYGPGRKPKLPADSALPVARHHSVSVESAPNPPADFPLLLAQTADHAAASAMQAALRRARIPFTLLSERSPANRIIYLFVRPDDKLRATEIAAAVLTRRGRVQSLPRQRIPREAPDSSGCHWDINIGDW